MNEKKMPLGRLCVVFFTLFSLLALVLGRFFVLQVIEGTLWEEKANKQHLFKLREPFYRGRFLLQDPDVEKIEKRATLLSSDIIGFNAYLDTKVVKEPFRQQILEKLLSDRYIEKVQKDSLQTSLRQVSRSRRILYGLSLAKKKELEKYWEDFSKRNKLERNALFFVQTNRRSHLQGNLLSYLVHTTQTHRNETTLQAEPTGGLEQLFDPNLKGKVGEKVLQRTLKKTLSSCQSYLPALHGDDITLTIHPRLQAEAEKILEMALVRYQAKNAWAIAIDPYSGKILCLAQAPGFDPKNYWKTYNDPKSCFCTKIWGAVDAYEPGSVLKPLNLAIALTANETFRKRNESALFDPGHLLPLGSLAFPRRGKTLKDVTFSRFCNMDMALQRSSNLYFGHLIQLFSDREGPKAYTDAVRNLGFGHTTGIEMPSESRGVVPTPGKKNIHGRLEWSAPTPVSMAMGHNLMTTSFQLLRAYSALANGGWLIRPTLVEEIFSKEKAQPYCVYTSGKDGRSSSRKVLSNTVSSRVLQSMAYTLKKPGSSARAELPRYSLCAKTGTANKIDRGHYDENRTLSTFIGILPAHKPRLLLLISIDEPKRFYIMGEGYNHRAGFCVAPLFRQIMSKAVQILGIPPDQPESYLPSDPRFTLEKSYYQRENRLLQEIYQKWNSGPPASS